MERLYSVLLSILVTVSLTGCLGSNDSENSDDDNDSDSIGNNETTILFEGDNLENKGMELTTTEMVYSIVTTLMCRFSSL